MTITYNLDVPHNHLKGFLSILFRWQGSVWKAVSFPLFIWLISFYTVFFIYQFLLRPYDQMIFDKVVEVLEVRVATFIPMTFILGFFVSSVLGRWQDWLKNIGGIESTAVAVATYIEGDDDATRATRRTIIRYLVLSQTFVLRNISVQVRRRFPTLEAIVAANLMTTEERLLIEETTDEYTQFWIPSVWAEKLLAEARKNGKIPSDPIAANISARIDEFRTHLKNMILFDWIPIPLVYPQLVTFCVRLYFLVCLFTRQISKTKETTLPDSPLFWLPVTTIVEFIVYMGWLKVAEDMLHPLGETFGGNFECNHIIDTNLITGLSLVDSGATPIPSLRKDAFWDSKTIAPLYTFETANRDIFSMTGTAANVNYVEKVDRILMVPHKSRLIKMNKEEQDKSFISVDVQKYNAKFKKYKKQQMNMDEDIIIKKLRKKANQEELEQMMVKTPLIEDVMLKL